MSLIRVGQWCAALIAAGLGACAIDEGAEAPAAPPEIPSWDEFLASSTKHFEGREIYVADGDLAVSLEELRREYDRLAGAGGEGTATQPSTVNTVGGQDDVWGPTEAQNLLYCVSNEFGPLKARVVSEMAQAAAAWEGAGSVNFIYNLAQDTNCVGGNQFVTFAVRPWSSGGACAFFPSGGGCVPRTVVIDYTDLDSGAYGPVTSVGVLRHELGHTLGLRHEHIRAPGTFCTEDSSWRGVTAYDSASVMHYPWCPGSTNTGDLRITSFDASGIVTLYPRFRRALTEWTQPEGGWDGFTLHTADVSGDGRADLIWNQLNGTNRTYVAVSNGNGTFTRALTAWDQPETGWQDFKLHVADVTGDGKADLVWSLLGPVNRTYVAVSNGNGTFTRALTAWDQPETGWTGMVLTVADVTGDGRADLVWNYLDTVNLTYVAVSNGNGTFTRALTAWSQPESGWQGFKLHVADVNGDGLRDLTWNALGAVNRTYISLSNGNGTFTRALTAWDQPESDWTGYTLTIADVTGDGIDDLIWNVLSNLNRTYVAVATGTGFLRLSAWDQPEVGWAMLGFKLSVGDVTGDGRADLVWNALGAANRTFVASGNSNGTFTRAVIGWNQPESNWGGYTLSVADITGDGKRDLIWNRRATLNQTFTAVSVF